MVEFCLLTQPQLAQSFDGFIVLLLTVYSLVLNTLSARSTHVLRCSNVRICHLLLWPMPGVSERPLSP